MVVVQLFLLMAICIAVHGQQGDIIRPGQSLPDGKTLVSAGGTFVLGFFTPRDSKSNLRYLGIWYNSIIPLTTVWVANRENPLKSSDGVLNLTNDGDLLLRSNSRTTDRLWSTGTVDIINSYVQLQDSGNLVLVESSSGTTKWQSFDYPFDTLLPKLKLGVDLGTNLERHLTSWKSNSDPSPGDFTGKMDTDGVPELLIRKGNKTISRSGPWNGNGFSGRPDMQRQNDLFRFEFVFNRDNIYYTFDDINSSFLSRSVLCSDGSIKRFSSQVSNPAAGWTLYWTMSPEKCDTYAICGANGVCSTSTAECSCLKGFDPKNTTEQTFHNYSGGCTRTNFSCNGGNGFYKLPQAKLPDTSLANSREKSSLEDCKDWCLSNCSCAAYSIVNGSRCIIWIGDLFDIQLFDNGGDTLYVRVSEIGNSNKHVLVIVVSVALGFLLLSTIGLFLRWKKGRRTPVPSIVAGRTREPNPHLMMSTNSRVGPSLPAEAWGTAAGTETNTATSSLSNDNSSVRSGFGIFPSYNLSTVEAATNNFSDSNKLGEGSFGIVYEGVLEEEKKIAVKRLKHLPRQLVEFKNELSVIANLQHKNLVRLLGYCVERNERILVLEYMENKSLDDFIYDKGRSVSLGWQKRLDIIVGIARGMQYLHQDCNNNVVHRDLKLSNILLDEEMNPKIADFGLARIFEGDDAAKHKFTNRPRGTFGYMAPEYIMGGLFSFKSDVFSFGVILLEILSGKKNQNIKVGDSSTNLIRYAYNLWEQGRSLEILDDALIRISDPPLEVIRFIRVGLLCVQEKSEDRPGMAEVVVMLSSRDVLINSPKPFTESMVSMPGDFFSYQEITSITMAR